MNFKQKICKSGLTLSLFLSLGAVAFAQKNQDEDDDLLTNKEKTVKDYTSKVIHQNELLNAARNNASVTQKGNGLESNVSQTFTGVGNPNVVIIMQNGNNHESSIEQVGNGNTSVVDQNGNHNRYSGYISGEDNKTTITQKGNNNLIDHELIGNDRVIDYTQKGNNNNITLDSYGSNAAPPQILQQGNNMNLRIEVR